MAAASGVNEIADRYATALFDLADEKQQLDAVADDLRQIEKMLGESDELTRLVRSPVISRDEHGKAMAALLEKMQANELTKKFIGYAAANRRLFALGGIIRAYLEALAHRRGEITAVVTSARELSEEQRASLEAELQKTLGTSVSIAEKVNPKIIGGLIVQVGSRMLDASISTQLQKLKLAMKGA